MYCRELHEQNTSLEASDLLPYTEPLALALQKGLQSSCRAFDYLLQSLFDCNYKAKKYRVEDRSLTSQTTWPGHGLHWWPWAFMIGWARMGPSQKERG